MPAAVFVIMFAIGLGLAPRDFRSTLTRPRALLLGLAAQMVLVPATGVLLVAIQQPEAAIGLGIVILALCPGGASSNILTRLAGGDVALSVSLTAVTNLLSVATLPVLSVLAARHFLGVELAAVEMRQVLLRVALIATLPVLLGTLVRHLAPAAAARHEPMVFRAAFALFLGIVGWAIVGSIEVLRDGMLLLGWQLAFLTLLLLGLGHGLGWLFGLAAPQRIAVGIETGVQNGALGLAVGSLLWADGAGFPLYATPSAVYGALTYALTYPLVILLWRLRRRV
nr:bile acid:sodium symporter [Rhodovulum strictum]